MNTINKKLQTLPIKLNQLTKYNSYLESDQSFDDFYNDNFLEEIISQDYTYTDYDTVHLMLLSVPDQDWLDFFKSVAKLAYNLNEITKEGIDWEEQFGFLKEGVDYLMEESKKDRKVIQKLKKELREVQTQVIKTELYEINLNFYNDHHSWEYADGTEGGELIIKNKELIDYDGTYQLGSQILIALNKEGINVQDII
jgi:hypothetical protein